MWQGPPDDTVPDRLSSGHQMQRTILLQMRHCHNVLKQSLRQLLVPGGLGSAADMPDRAAEQSLHTS